MAVDGWAVTFGTTRRGLGGAAARPGTLVAVPNVTTHSVQSSYFKTSVIKQHAQKYFVDV